MNLLSQVTDNITELLIKIVKFTQARQKVLSRNINKFHLPGFMPEDLTADEFSDVLHDAIDEHTKSQRLLLCDTENIKFGTAGHFEAKPVTDKYARKLLVENPDKYLELQINRLLENSLNQRVAAELLKQKQGTASIFE